MSVTPKSLSLGRCVSCVWVSLVSEVSDVGGDAFIVSGQSKQTQVQEWTQWKQWALDHKDFPAYKEEALNKIKKHNEKLALQLQKKEVQDEIENLLKKRQETDQRQCIFRSFVYCLNF